eukprot:jgi/Bigna1/78111/fgenesh1_pg.52_\
MEAARLRGSVDSARGVVALFQAFYASGCAAACLCGLLIECIAKVWCIDERLFFLIRICSARSGAKAWGIKPAGRKGKRPPRKREILKAKKEKLTGIREIWPKPQESNKAYKRRINAEIQKHIDARKASKRRYREARVGELDQVLLMLNMCGLCKISHIASFLCPFAKSLENEGDYGNRRPPPIDSSGKTTKNRNKLAKRRRGQPRVTTTKLGAEVMDFRDGREKEFGPAVYSASGVKIAGMGPLHAEHASIGMN